MATTPVPQDQRKRTLEEALERRFAVAKAELFQQQKKKNNKTFVEEDGKETPSRNSSFLNTPIATSSNSSSKKGPSSSQDVEENGEVYSKLSQPMRENLLHANIKLSDKKGNMADKILHELLQGGDAAQKYMQGSRSVKFDNWILLDNFVKGRLMSTGSQIRALKTRSKRSKRHMSRKQLKKSGVLKLPQDNQKKNQLAQCIIGADLLGALIFG